MGVRFQVPRKALLVRFLMHPAGKILLVLLILGVVLSIGTFTFYYARYARLIDEKLRAGAFESTSMIFGAPTPVAVGDVLTAGEVVEQLRRSGYTESRTNPLGWYHLRDDAVEIFPGQESYFDQEAGVIRFADGRVSQIISLRDNSERHEYQLEPELITNLFDKKREKRRIVAFRDLPKVLVNAVVSVEDKRFFQHAGFDPLRIMKAAYVDLKERRKEEGASTLSMQLARSFWLDQRKTWRRKAAEVLITMHLEQKLTKEEIFEYYANEVDLGRKGSFSIRGFGEAAQAYFNKDVRDLTLAEAATLAGVIQRPSFTNPIRWPERAQRRRNIVLQMMHENGYITDQQHAEAVSTPLTVVKGGGGSSDAPYFVDLVNDELQDRFQDRDFQSNTYRIYTTLDLDLQRDATEAVRIGLQETDEILNRRRKGRNADLPEAQVALVALDPKTGEVRALVGGRNYGISQLNRALAKRQPGSAFKPFVYAAALEASLQGRLPDFTPLTTVMDEPTTFWFDDKPYEPGNFKQEYYGAVTVRQALTKSLNIPTVKVAEMTGYESVVDLARRAGMNLHIKPTPAVALGAYEVTPIEVGGAYTVFVNHGVHAEPYWLKSVRDEKGQVLYSGSSRTESVLDPRVAFEMVDLLQEVVRRGTAAGVRSRGFSLPAAGKTGTSHDGWFAGFTSKLVCVVWVGFDDNRELGVEGARSALPIWTEFMKRAHEHRQYRNARSFEAPDGIVMVEIDPLSGGLATPTCPKTEMQAFLAGSQPVEGCRLHGGEAISTTQVSGWETEPAADNPEGEARPHARPRPSTPSSTPQSAQSKPEKKPEQRQKGIFRRLLDMFK